MKSTLEHLDPSDGRRLVKLAVEVDESEFDRDVDQAFRKIAKEVRLPGFRAGKAPRRVLEARIGIAPAREQALRDAIPSYLAKAVREHDVDLIATPQVEIRSGADAGPVAFDATCEVRPVVVVPGYAGLRVELPNPAASVAEIDDAVTNELRRHGVLTDVDRPVARGDVVTLDLRGTRNGEAVVGLDTEDWSYEVGQGWVADSLDDELLGVTAGAHLEFTDRPKGTDVDADFEIDVKAVQELVLPELDDDWVAENVGEHDTVAAWRAELGRRISAGKLNQARGLLVDRTTTALAGLVDVDPPESMVSADLQARVQNTVQRFQAQGIAIEQWLAMTGQSTDDFIAGLREQSTKAVKVDLALRAVADAEAIAISDDDVEAEYARIAIQVNQKAAQVRRAYERNDAVADLVAQLRKSKALDFLLHCVELVDPDGHPLDRDEILGHDHDHAHDHDHDNDHAHDPLDPAPAAADTEDDS